MNRLINDILNHIPSPIRWAIGIAFTVILIAFLWYKGTQLWNGIGNTIFAAKMSWQGRKLEQELQTAEQQKKVIEQSMLELAAAKGELAGVKAEKDRLEKVFNDHSKTAAEKVAEFKKAVADDPISTPTDNVTISDLCQRARNANASAATIAALCGQ